MWRTEQDLERARKALADAQAEVQRLEKIRKAELEQPFNKKLAISLHDSQCHWNHTDGCGWYYEIKNKEHDWSAWTHQEYLKKADQKIRMFTSLGIHTEETILTLVKELR